MTRGDKPSHRFRRRPTAGDQPLTTHSNARRRRSITNISSISMMLSKYGGMATMLMAMLTTLSVVTAMGPLRVAALSSNGAHPAADAAALGPAGVVQTIHDAAGDVVAGQHEWLRPRLLADNTAPLAATSSSADNAPSIADSTGDPGEACFLNGTEHECNFEPQLFCQDRDYGAGVGVCTHKSIFSPFAFLDFLLCFLCFFGSSLAVIGGVGGGGLFVPLLMIITHFKADQAVPISSTMITAAAIMSLLFEIRAKRPNGRPVIDYDVSFLLQPVCLAGTTLGVFLNVLLPGWMIILALLVILVYTTTKTMKKGITMYKKESQQRRALANGGTSANVAASAPAAAPLQKLNKRHHKHQDKESLVASTDTSAEQLSVNMDDSDLSDSEDAGRIQLSQPVPSEAELPSKDQVLYQRQLDQELRFPTTQILGMIAMWLIVLACSTIKRFVSKCSAEFWIVAFLPLPIAILVTLWYGRRLRDAFELKQRCGHQFEPTDFVFNRRNTIVYPLLSFGGGLAGGMVGVGGAMVIGPLLLNMAVQTPDPSVTTAISNLLVVFTAASTVIQFVILNTLVYDYALFLSAFTLMASVLSKKVLKPWFDNKGRKSFVVFALVLSISLSGILTAIEGILKVAHVGFVTTLDTETLCN